MLHLLTEIRDSVQAVGRRCEAHDSNEQIDLTIIDDLDEFKELERSLSDAETAKAFVTLILTK